MKKLTLLLVIWAMPAWCQSHNFPALDTTNVYSGTNIFNGPVTFGQTVSITSLTVTTLSTTGPGYIQTFQCQTAPSNPPAGSILYYCDSGTGLFTTLKSNGTSANPGGATWGTVMSGTNSNAGTYTATGNSWDFTAVTQFRLRAAAGLTTSANGGIGYDTTNNNWHCWQNGADCFFLTGSAAGSYTVGNCTKIASINPLTFADSGGACGSAGSASPLLFSAGAQPSTSVTDYIGAGVLATTEAVTQIPVPRSGAVSNLQCRSSGTLSSSQTMTMTVRKGLASGSFAAITSSDTAITCQENSTNVSGCSDVTHNFTVAAGDVLDIKTVPANTPATGTMNCSVQLL